MPHSSGSIGSSSRERQWSYKEGKLCELPQHTMHFHLDVFKELKMWSRWDWRLKDAIFSCRCNTLISLIEKENNEIEEKEKAERAKKKSEAKKEAEKAKKEGTPSKSGKRKAAANDDAATPASSGGSKKKSKKWSVGIRDSFIN